MVLSFTPFNKEVDNMSYEKFITDFLNIKPSELSKISRIIKLFEGLPKFLRGKLEGFLIFNTVFLRVNREGLV